MGGLLHYFHHFTEALRPAVRKKLLQLLPHFLESLLHLLNFKLSVDTTAITSSRLFQRAIRGMSLYTAIWLFHIKMSIHKNTKKDLINIINIINIIKFMNTFRLLQELL
jgi:hypothetical protein